MPRKKTSSQWDFGELFTPEETRQVWSVGELTGKVKRALETELGTVWVSGEITNLRRQNSGHIYFSIKDERAQLNCVLFRGQEVDNRDLLEDGKEAILRGDLTVYEARGQYQLLVREIEFKGVGALQAEFEKLKSRLEAEGLFDPERKRPLPRLNRAIGVVTSPTGAALHDVQHVIARRDPRLSVILAPCRVQGKGAAKEIAEAIDALNEFHAKQPERGGLDLILITRGGGSLEDLWAFNEEAVAQAVFRSTLPVVSAIGHEIDFTISDFVADLRAATPSAAAELITEGVFSSLGFIADAPRWLAECVARRLARESENLARLQRRLSLARPSRRIGELVQRLDDLQTGMSNAVGYRFETLKRRGAELAGRLGRLRPSRQLQRKREAVKFLNDRLMEHAASRLESLRVRLARVQDRLRLLSPGSVLERGYSITMDAKTGEVIRSTKKVQTGQKIRTRLDDGEFESVVED
ncbi:MAG: exodeoxyribonuclease VII large subunit [Candidatus Binatia bacterium]|jgi:exodeoxyribonuclease VII large subunit